jgi:hypothetical protein
MKRFRAIQITTKHTLVEHKLHLQVQLPSKFWDTIAWTTAVDFYKEPTMFDSAIIAQLNRDTRVRILATITEQREMISEFVKELTV